MAAKKKSQDQKDVLTLLQGVNKKMGKEIAKPIYEALKSEVKIWIPTGVPTVDLLTGGGLPVGKVVEFFGKEKCGKSTIALQACINARKMGGMVIYIDTEHTIEKGRAKQIGLNTEDDPFVIVLEPSNFEEGFRTINNLLQGCKEIESLKEIPFTLVVWDTLAFTASETEWDENGEFKHDMGKRAGRLRQYMRRLLMDCADSNVCFLSLNHETENLANTNAKVKSYSTPGGTAFKFASSLMVRMIPVNGQAERWMLGEDQLGQPIRFKLVHTRLSPAKREVEAMLNYYTGFDAPMTVLRHLKEAQLLDKKGNTYIIRRDGQAELTFSSGDAGEKKFVEMWRNDPELQKDLLESMRSHYEAIIPWKNPNGIIEVQTFDNAEDFAPPDNLAVGE